MDSTSPLISETANYLNRQFTNIDQISSKQQMELEVEGQRYFLSVTPFADEYGLDWLIGIAISESNLMGAVEANTRATILVSLIILAGTLILGIVITRKITHPILQLNRATQEMSLGRWEKIENNTRFKEVRSLTNSFNQMAWQLSKTLETLEHRVQERTSELTSVNKQLQVEIAERKKTETDRERLITELQKALENVKTLSGFLPICSHCKKIRDDDGKWHDVADYVHDRSEAEFSHGICPECAQKYYPDFDIYSDK
ncbi:signal transduction family protein (GGDEF domain protein) [Desulforapulum autotrophicum HRM2]|uniref:histidine kinase n=2 Tax=Desulforapulum autotrophicum TaxID=2296 RepID=C0QIR2_DESAH|nr:signal transduction family protein (GGDEF domain protein) [Desulforapulum autotrophicum HRM2]